MPWHDLLQIFEFYFKFPSLLASAWYFIATMQSLGRMLSRSCAHRKVQPRVVVSSGCLDSGVEIVKHETGTVEIAEPDPGLRSLMRLSLALLVDHQPPASNTRQLDFNETLSSFCYPE